MVPRLFALCFWRSSHSEAWVAQLPVVWKPTLCLPADTSLPQRARTSSSRPRPPKIPLEQSFPLADHAPVLITLSHFRPLWISSTLPTFSCLASALFARAPLSCSPSLAPPPLRIIAALGNNDHCPRAVAQHAYSYAYLDVHASDQMTMWVFMVRQRSDAQCLEPTRMRCQVSQPH